MEKGEHGEVLRELRKSKYYMPRTQSLSHLPGVPLVFIEHQLRPKLSAFLANKGILIQLSTTRGPSLGSRTQMPPAGMGYS